MRIFDFHIHVGNDTPVEEVTGFLDRAGIERGLLLAADHGPWDEGRPGALCRDESVARIVKESRGRLVGLSSVSPTSEGGAGQKAEKGFAMGLSGLKIYPHGGFYPNDKRLYDAYELAQDKGFPVLIHTGIKAQSTQRMIYNNPIYIDDIAVDFPHLKIIIMHSGYPWVTEAITVARLNSNVMVDLSFLDVLENTFEEGLVYNTVKRLKKVIGVDRLVWGSEGENLGLDMFCDDGLDRVKQYIKTIQDLDFLSYDEKNKILYENAYKLMIRY